MRLSAGITRQNQAKHSRSTWTRLNRSRRTVTRWSLRPTRTSIRDKRLTSIWTSTPARSLSPSSSSNASNNKPRHNSSSKCVEVITPPKAPTRKEATRGTKPTTTIAVQSVIRSLMTAYSSRIISGRCRAVQNVIVGAWRRIARRTTTRTRVAECTSEAPNRNVPMTSDSRHAATKCSKSNTINPKSKCIIRTSTIWWSTSCSHSKMAKAARVAKKTLSEISAKALQVQTQNRRCRMVMMQVRQPESDRMMVSHRRRSSTPAAVWITSSPYRIRIAHQVATSKMLVRRHRAPNRLQISRATRGRAEKAARPRGSRLRRRMRVQTTERRRNRLQVHQEGQIATMVASELNEIARARRSEAMQDSLHRPLISEALTTFLQMVTICSDSRSRIRSLRRRLPSLLAF